MSRPRRIATVIVHDLAQVRAALAAAAEAGAEIRLLTPPGGAHYAGPGFYAELARQAAAEHPRARFRFTLDCGDDAALALEALGAGWQALVLRRAGRVWDKAAGVASRHGAALHRRAPAALDLIEVKDAGETCRKLLLPAERH